MCLNMTATQPFPIWNLKNSQIGITALSSYDIVNNGKNSIMLAREDSTLELYTLDINNEL